MGVKLFDKTKEEVRYTDSTGTTRRVGHVGRNFDNVMRPRGKGDTKFEKAFVWNQSPLQMESTGGSVAYGMSKGLYELLVEKEVDAVYVEAYRISMSDIEQSEIVDPAHDGRFQQDELEEQFVIKP